MTLLIPQKSHKLCPSPEGAAGPAPSPGEDFRDIQNWKGEESPEECNLLQLKIKSERVRRKRGGDEPSGAEESMRKKEIKNKSERRKNTKTQPKPAAVLGFKGHLWA